MLSATINDFQTNVNSSHVVDNVPTSGFPTQESTTVNEISSFSDQTGKTSDESRMSVQGTHMDPYEQTQLSDFLARPFQVANFNWTSSDSQYSTLALISFPHALLVKPQIRNKIANFQYLRCNFRFSLRINSTRFHYGRLMMAFYPNLRNSSNSITGPSFVTGCSLNNLQVSATSAEVTELFVPFSLPFEFMDMTQMSTNYGANLYECGTIIVYVMNALSSPDSAPVGVTLFASMEDVVFGGFTPDVVTTIAPQGIAGAAPITNGESFSQYVIDNNPFTYAIEQAGEDDSEQREKSSEGVVSGIAEKVASFAAPFTMIPGVGGIATAVATGASAIGNIAKSFGFQKPIAQIAEQPFITRFPVLAHGAGLESAPILGAKPDNKVAPNSEYISGHEDDMQFSRIFSTPGYVGYFDVTSSDAADSTVYELNVTPVEHLVTATTDVNTVFSYHTPLSYAVAPFEYWRGSLRYHFQVVASSFHSCRLRIYWLPPGLVSTTDPDRTVNTVNHVLDINTDTEAYISIPFLNSLPWLSVPVSNGDQLTPFGFSMNGKLVVQVVNPLIYSGEPVPPIGVNVWLSAGPDFQVAFPNDYRLYIQDPPVVVDEIDEEPPALEEAGTTLESLRTHDYPPMLNAKYFVDTNICHGEQITNLKTLLQRPSSDEVFYSPGFWRFSPLGRHYRKNTFFSWYQRLFRYFRGSFGIRLTDVAGGCVFQNRRVISPPLRISQLTSLGPLGVGSHYVPDLTTFIPEAIAPYYATQAGIPNPTGSDSAVSPNSPAIDFQVKGTATFRILEFVGDDFQFGNMVGAPAHFTDIRRWFYNNTA